MGAWGPGMQANDTALDAIVPFEVMSGPRAGKLRLNVQRRLEAGKTKPIDLLKDAAKDFKKAGWPPGREITWAVLGLADFLLDNDIDLSVGSYFIKQMIKVELRRDRLNCWTDPAERKDALLRFQARLEGRPYDKDASELDNAPLFARMLIPHDELKKVFKKRQK